MIRDIIDVYWYQRYGNIKKCFGAGRSALTDYMAIKLSLCVIHKVLVKAPDKRCMYICAVYTILPSVCLISSLSLWLCVMCESESISLALPVGVFSLQVCVYAHMGACVKVTRRLLFPLMCITLTHFGSRKGKKGLAVAHTAGGLSRGYP